MNPLVSMYEPNRNSFHRIFHGQPISVEWDGWRSDTHVLERRGWEIRAEEGYDDYLDAHRLRLGLLSPEKTFLVTGYISFDARQILHGEMQFTEMMYREGFRNMSIIHKRDKHSIMPEIEFGSISNLKRIDIHAPMDVPSISMMRREFKFFNYRDDVDPKEIIIPAQNVDECLNRILQMQYPEQLEMKKKFIIPENQPIIQAKILSFAA